MVFFLLKKNSDDPYSLRNKNALSRPSIHLALAGIVAVELHDLHPKCGYASITEPLTKGVYVNHLDADDTARVKNAYGDNLQRLKEVKRKYDPDNFFRMNNNIVPRLSQNFFRVRRVELFPIMPQRP